MARDYVDNKIREALRLNGGSEARTKQQVHNWLYEDHRFLLELTRPHIKGIVAYSVSRAKNKMLTERAAEDEAAQAAKETADAQDAGSAKQKKKQAGFGETMLRSFVSDNAARFGYESSSPPVGRRTASQKHIDTMHMLVAKSKEKKAASEKDED